MNNLKEDRGIKAKYNCGDTLDYKEVIENTISQKITSLS